LNQQPQLKRLLLLEEPVLQVEEQVFEEESSIVFEEEGPIVFELDLTIKEIPVMADPVVAPEMSTVDEEESKEETKPVFVAPVASNAFGSFLKRPTNIYSNEPAAESIAPVQVTEEKNARSTGRYH